MHFLIWMAAAGLQDCRGALFCCTHQLGGFFPALVREHFLGDHIILLVLRAGCQRSVSMAWLFRGSSATQDRVGWYICL